MITHVYDFLEETLKKYSEKIAFIEPKLEDYIYKQITYKELDLSCKKLASEIIKNLGENSGIQKSILVILPKGIECLVTFFGVALSGNFYTLLDVKTPQDRINQVVKILNTKLVITSKKLKINIKLPTLYVEDLEQFALNNSMLLKIRQRHIDKNLFYVIFTSGSTGVPKGVSITHKSVIDYAFWFCKTFKINDSEVIANQAPLFTDASLPDILGTIKTGATLHLIPNNLFAFPNVILHYLDQIKATMIFWKPTILIYFASHEENLKRFSLKSLKKILVGGEIMPNKQLNIWRHYLEHALFANLYGPTEITDVCAYYIVDRKFRDDEILPIGKACKNIELLVFDENMQLISCEQNNIKGELYVRGTCLSLGYFGDSTKTKQFFIQNPLHDSYLDLLYRTGDIVAYNRFKELVCYGRNDNRIKYKGYRIELSEIETIVNSHPKITMCACVFKDKNLLFL